MTDKPIPQLARSLACYAMAIHGRTPRRVQVLLDFGDDNSESLTIPAQDLLILPEQLPQARPSPMEECILEAIGALATGELIRGEDLAAKAGYAYSGRFKELLARLAREGKIRSGRSGYSRS